MRPPMRHPSHPQARDERRRQKGVLMHGIFGKKSDTGGNGRPNSRLCCYYADTEQSLISHSIAILMKHLLPWFVAVTLLAGSLVSAQDGGKRGMRAADAALPPDAHELKIGDAAPDFALRGVDEKSYTLADFKDADLLM